MSRDSLKRYKEKNIEKIRQIEKKSHIKNRESNLKLNKKRYEHICDLIESRFENSSTNKQNKQQNKQSKRCLLSNLEFVRKFCKKTTKTK